MPGKKQEPAYLKPSVELKNTSAQTVQGILNVELEGRKTSLKVSLNPEEEKLVTIPEIKIINPRLWWPNGMGDHPLYTMKFDFISEAGRKNGFRADYFWNKGNRKLF